MQSLKWDYNGKQTRFCFLGQFIGKARGERKKKLSKDCVHKRELGLKALKGVFLHSTRSTKKTKLLHWFYDTFMNCSVCYSRTQCSRFGMDLWRKPFFTSFYIRFPRDFTSETHLKRGVWDYLPQNKSFYADYSDTEKHYSVPSVPLLSSPRRSKADGIMWRAVNNSLSACDNDESFVFDAHNQSKRSKDFLFFFSIPSSALEVNSP